jgi:hypothetical protein
MGLRTQVETPINATRTAFAEANIPTAIPIYVTQVAPSFTIVNSLALDVEILVDGTSRGIVEKYSSKTFVLDTYPVKVNWIIVKQHTGEGNSIGDDMYAQWDSVSDQEVRTIDSLVVDEPYFYPLITNTTDQSCGVIINDGLNSENRTGAALPPRSGRVGLGYYKLFTNSNVVLECGEKRYWWGERNGEIGVSGRLSELVEPGSGVLELTLEP